MYYKFIEKCKTKKFSEEYQEKHHIIPKYLGGNDDRDNIIRLPYRLHILAHLLLWRKYQNNQDLCAYNLMKGLSISRKIEIGKMIGNNNVKSGHILRLGQKNKETNWINTIKTKESLSKGGLIAGNIARESGQIYTIQTKDSCKRGGITQGNSAKLSGQIQSIAKYKGIYVLIMPDNTEFLHAYRAAEYMNVASNTISQRCYSGALGYSRRLKEKSEMGMCGILITG